MWNCDTKVDGLATFAGRFGLTSNQTLVYVKGGAAWAHDKYSLVRTEPVDPFSVTASETRTGWMLGAGVEYAFYSNWSAKLEYNFLDFGNERITLLGTFRGTNRVTPAVDIDQQVHLVKFGLNYRFNWGAVTARY